MQGIIILALQKSAYSTGAFNLALSIKHYNPNINITLVSDGEHLKHYRPAHFSVFNWIKEIKLCDYINTDGKFQPALAKIRINEYSTYDGTLYLDADSICLQDLQPFLDKLKGSEFKSNVIEGYTQWTDEKFFNEFFGFGFGKTINSSWYYWEKIDVFKAANEFYSKGFPVDKIMPKWGSGTLPDELFFNAAITKCGVDPKVDYEVMFFGNVIDIRTLTELQEQHYLFTLYGGIRTVRSIYIDWYDRLMIKICESKGMEHRFKSHGILTGKHVNNK
jgi:hypothetical protein